jgi:hypothetical protein
VAAVDRPGARASSAAGFPGPARRIHFPRDSKQPEPAGRWQVKANWWQTLLAAMLGALGPIMLTVANGASVTMKTAAFSVLGAGVTAGFNLLRSPLDNPPTIGPTKPSN